MESDNNNYFDESKTRARMQALLKVHLKKKQFSLPREEQLHFLKKRKRSRWWMLVINVVAILFFGYSFFFGITRLSNTLLYILLAVFIINVGLIFYQVKQLKELIAYFENEINR